MGAKYFDGTQYIGIGGESTGEPVTLESLGGAPADHNHDTVYQAKSLLIRDIHSSTLEPTAQDGNDGDLWIVHE